MFNQIKLKLNRKKLINQIFIYFIQQRFQFINRPYTYRISHWRCSQKIHKIHKKTPAPESPVNFVKFLRTPFLSNTSGRLLLHLNNISTHSDSLLVTFLYLLTKSFNLMKTFLQNQTNIKRTLSIQQQMQGCHIRLQHLQ